MRRDLTLTESVTIAAPASEVWKALTTPEIISEFMWGTHAHSEWRQGSAITFEGVYQGKPYRDKGTILEIDPAKKLKYSFLSGTTADIPENYSIITYDLTGDGNETKMSVTQEGANDEQALEHSRQGWKSIISNLKVAVEKRHAPPDA